MKGMKYMIYRLCSREQMDIEKTFECGQCFRWNADAEGVYRGIAMGYPARVWYEDGAVMISSDGPEEMWREYFDLERDYAAISREFQGGEYLERCIEAGLGIRILRQEHWEALCSFIISQCNNISRIKGIVERLCESFGEPVEFEGRRFYSFPQPEKLAFLREEDLAHLRSGYRAAYIINAANSIVSGALKMEELVDCDYKHAHKKLCELRGVGSKVANCVVLFGLYHMEAFPIDVWIKRALKEHFPKGFDPAVLGKYAGLAQQYIFYYSRNLNDGEKAVDIKK